MYSIPESPLLVLPSLAAKIGMCEAIILQQINYWLPKSDRCIDGQNWIWRTYEKWYAELNGLFGLTKIKQAIRHLKELELIIIEQHSSKNWYQANWYTLNAEKIQEIFSEVYGSRLVEFRPIRKIALVENSPIGRTYPHNPLVASERIILKTTSKEITLNNISPLTPQGEGEEEREKKKTPFGFQMPEDKEPQENQSPFVQNEETQKTDNSSLEPISPSAAPARKISAVEPFGRSKYERWADKNHPALVYLEGETFWLEPPTNTQFVVFNSAFVEWGAKDYMQRFTKNDIYQAKGDFIASLINEPERIAMRWEQYQGHMIHHAATITARLNNGIAVSADEKEKMIKHQKAFTGADVNKAMIDKKVLDAAANKPASQPLHALEPPVPVVDEDVWEQISEHTKQWESEQIAVATIAPEGAVDVEMYTRTVKSEDSAYDQKLYEEREKMTSDKKRDVLPTPQSEEEVKALITEFVRGKKMPNSLSDEERSRIRDNEKIEKKVQYWNSLLATGLPSVVAEVEKQVRTSDKFAIIDGRVELEF